MATYGYLLPVRGVVPGSRGPAEQATRMADLLRLARTAEALGFDLWVTDSFSSASSVKPLPWRASG